MISNLGYVVLEVSNLGNWEKFAVDIIGLQISEKSNHTLSFRVDNYKARIFLQQGPADDLFATGWEFKNESQLLAYVEELSTKNIYLNEANEDLLKQRNVKKMFYFVDQSGIQQEFFYAATRCLASNPFKSDLLLHGFKTGDLGLGHFVVADSMDGALTNFYQNQLGMKVTDYCYGDIAPNVNMEVTFFHTGSQRHHSVATSKLPFKVEKKMHHLMLEVNSMVDVGLTYDRCVAAGLTFEMNLGSHPNDQMFSFYVHTPSGFALEIGYGAITVDDKDWDVKSYNELSTWGHKRSPTH